MYKILSRSKTESLLMERMTRESFELQFKFIGEKQNSLGRYRYRFPGRRNFTRLIPRRSPYNPHPGNLPEERRGIGLTFGSQGS